MAAKAEKRLIWANEDNSGQLHCDACGFDLKEPQKFNRDLVGFPCPVCGESMLTLRDYESTVRLYKIVNAVNFIGRIFGLGRTKEDTLAAVRNGGEGSVEVKIHEGRFHVK